MLFADRHFGTNCRLGAGAARPPPLGFGQRSPQVQPQKGSEVTLFTELLGWTLAILSAVSIWPQAVRSWRLHTVQGLSTTSVAAASSTMVVWLFYTYSVGDVPAWSATAAALLALLVVLQVMLNIEQRGAKRIVWLLLAVTAVAWLAYRAGLGYELGWVAGIGSALWMLPQLRSALTAPDLRGVSVPAFALVALESLGWAVYGGLTGSPSYLIGPAVQLPSASIIAWRTWRNHFSQAAHS